MGPGSMGGGGGGSNPFAGLTAQVLRAAASVKGVTDILGGVQSALRSVTAAIEGDFKRAVTQLSTAAGKAAAGLAAMGVASLSGGFSVLGQVVEYMASVIGVVGAPVFLTLAAVAMAVVQSFQDNLITAAVSVGNAMIDLVKGIQLAIDAIKHLGQVTRGVIAEMGSKGMGIANWMFKQMDNTNVDDAKKLSILGQVVTKVLGNMGRDQANDAFKKAGQIAANAPVPGNAKAAGAGAGKFMDDVIQNMDDLLKSLVQSLAMKANVGFTGIGDISRVIQQQAFKSAIEQRTLDNQTKTIAILQKMLDAFKQQRAVPAVAQ